MKTLDMQFARFVSGWLCALMLGMSAAESLAASAKPAGPPKQHQLSGSIVSCDEKTLVVRIKKGEEIKFAISIESKFGEKGENRNADDFKPGNHVRVTYVRSGGERVLKQVVPVVKHIN